MRRIVSIGLLLLANAASGADVQQDCNAVLGGGPTERLKCVIDKQAAQQRQTDAVIADLRQQMSKSQESKEWEQGSSQQQIEAAIAELQRQVKDLRNSSVSEQESTVGRNAIAVPPGV